MISILNQRIIKLKKNNLYKELKNHFITQIMIALLSSIKQGSFKWSTTIKNIDRPDNGNIVQRTDLKTKQQKTFVVYKTVANSRGKNSDIKNILYLALVTKYDPKHNMVYYMESNYPLVLQLTTSGNWFNKELKKNTEWQWLTHIPSYIEHSISISLSTPIEIKRVPINITPRLITSTVIKQNSSISPVSCDKYTPFELISESLSSSDDETDDTNSTINIRNL